MCGHWGTAREETGSKEARKPGHNVNMKKQSPSKFSKKWCYYELHEKGSCTYGEDCRFNHEVPKDGQDVMKSWFQDLGHMSNNKLRDLSANLSTNAEKTESKMHHFLANVIKEMIGKELKKRAYSRRPNEAKENQKSAA